MQLRQLLKTKKLVIFDIDDTLVYTQTKIHVIKNGKIIKSLTGHEHSKYKLGPGEKFDFGDFEDPREFFEKSVPNIPMINQLKHDIETGNKVVMVTGRGDFHDDELFLDTFRKFGINMNKVHVFRAGKLQGNFPTHVKKKIIIKELLENDNYQKVIMYDDLKDNLDSFIDLKKEFPNTKFYAWHVSLEGIASEYRRSHKKN